MSQLNHHEHEVSLLFFPSTGVVSLTSLVSCLFFHLYHLVMLFVFILSTKTLFFSSWKNFNIRDPNHTSTLIVFRFLLSLYVLLMFSTDLAKYLKVDCVWVDGKGGDRKSKYRFKSQLQRWEEPIIYSVLTWVHLPLCLKRKCIKYESTIRNGHERRGSTHRLWLVRDRWDLTSEKKRKDTTEPKRTEEVHYETCWREEELAKGTAEADSVKVLQVVLSSLDSHLSRRKRDSFLFLTNKTNSCSLTLDHQLSVSLLLSGLPCSRLSFWLSIHLREKKHSQEEGKIFGTRE